MSNIDNFIQSITVVEFRAFDKDKLANGEPMEHFFRDATPVQCINYIRKNVCETAVVKKCTEFKVSESINHNVIGL